MEAQRNQSLKQHLEQAKGGLLKDKRTYLAGAMENVTEADATKWRDHITEELHKLGIKVFDPCRSKEEDIKVQRNYIRTLKAARRFDALRDKMKSVVRQDLRCVDLVDFVIVYLPPGVNSTGTIHELIQADLEKKPTLVVCEDLTRLADWFFGIIPLQYMFEAFDQLVEYLYLVDRGFIKDDPRWQFLDFK